MYSVYRSSVFSIASTASRRVYHSSIRSLKASVNGPKPATAKPTNVQSATADPSKAKRAASSSSSSSSSSFAKENPFVFQLGVATAKTSAADLVAQIVAEKKSLDEVDWKRNFIFVVFGFAYLGAFQYWLMVNKFRQWFPTMDRFAKLSFADKLKDKAGIIDAAKMVVFDVTVHLPMIYFPTYYTVKEFVGGKTWNPADWAMDGVSKYVNNAKDDLTAMIKLWGPSDCIQFVLPMHIRLPFRHLVSFFWTAYVSFTRGSLEDGSSEEEQAQEA
mmetsp:Transcript_24830/g.54631  ORF Transcript_24830/g.54631 Transcript_24830/m.54631 type:complete len:273 (-) Transcript_24830:247-1065(-)